MFCLMPDEIPLVPADPISVQRALELALTYYSGHPRRRAKFTEADELKVAITAGHLAKQLQEAGFIIMRKAPETGGFSHLMHNPARRRDNT
jgi:hypothetical protein